MSKFTSLFCVLLVLWDHAGALPTEGDMELILERRRTEIMASYNNPTLALQLRDSLEAPGVWTDVDYTTGCPARRANWPAQDHFHKIITMATYWSQNQGDTDMRNKISTAMNYWFDRDYPNNDCINAGGRDDRACPCGTPGFWNTNWYCQMILMPTLIGNACLVLQGSLTSSQLGNCTVQIQRAYDRVDGDPGAGPPHEGANMLDISSNAVSLSLLTSNPELLDEAYGRYFNECQITTGSQDGIKVDGTFFQHDRQIYNGNYGAVFLAAMVRLFAHTENTTIVPPISTQEAFLTLFEGDEWHTFVRAAERRLIWQYPVVGRMVSWKHSDWHGANLHLNGVESGTRTWATHDRFLEIVERLRATDGGVNAGPLLGTRFFHAADTLVHRARNYIVTLKMFSTRTSNSECNNGQNPFGFHLSDGTVYTWLHGSEYVDVYGAWDWNLVPGTTTDYGATNLRCDQVKYSGLESWVGAAVNGHAAVASMKYTNPLTSSLSWGKAWFFFPGAYVVQFVGDVVPRPGNSAPIITTLDQRQRAGPVYVDGAVLDEGDEVVNVQARSVWHDRVGYTFLATPTVNMTVDTRLRPSNWSAIGISDGFEPQELYAATIRHPEGAHNADHLAYAAYLDVDQERFTEIVHSGDEARTKIDGVEPIRILTPPVRTDGLRLVVVRGATYGSAEGNGERLIGLAFWESGYYVTGEPDIIALEATTPVLLLLRRKPEGGGWSVAVSDPSQLQTETQITVHTSQSGAHILPVQLPSGPWAGSTVTLEL